MCLLQPQHALSPSWVSIDQQYKRPTPSAMRHAQVPKGPTESSQTADAS